MEREKLLLAVLVMGFFGSAALALAPMGPPVATLPQGQYAGGIGYAFSEMTLEVSGPISPTGDGELDDIQSNIYYINLGYGISNTWSVYGAIGMADAEFDADSGSDFSGDTQSGFAIGTRRTLQDDGGKIKWGTVFQYCRGQSEDKINAIAGQSFGDGSISLTPGVEKAELDWYEIQLAFGPVVQVKDNLCVYGGPFLHFVEGDLEFPWDNNQYELEQRSEIGAYIGALYNVKANTNLSAEILTTNDAWGIAVGASIGF